MSGSAGRADRERSWAAHVRSGGTTPWSAWAELPAAEDDSAADPGAGSSGPLPGAAQLELLRRLNRDGVTAELAAHVLERAGPGRGRASLRLPWPAGGRGAAPETEVVRVGVGVLADLTVRLPSPVTGRPPRRRRLRKAPTFALEGPPLTTAQLRADLAAAGLREHRPTRPWFGRRPETPPEVVLVVVGSLVDGLNEAWSRRVQRGGMQSWRGFLASWDARADLPPAASPLVAVDRWADRVGAANVHVVTTDLLARQVADVLGRGPGAGTPEGRAGDGEPVPLRPALADVLRRVNAVLPFLLPGEEAPARRTALARLMQQEQVGPRRLTMPEARRPWAARAAAAVAEELHGRGCTVHGDLGVLGRDVEGPDRRLRAGELATATVRMIHRVDERLDAASDRTQGVRR